MTEAAVESTQADETATPTKETAEVEETTEITETAAPAASEDNKDFSGDYSDTGDGTIAVVTPSGSSEAGDVPVLFVEADTILTQIELDTSGFDGAHLSYIYVDGMLNITEQVGDSQMTLDLSGDALAEGQHSVEVVQYDTDEPTGTVVTYKSAFYEVKVE